MLVEVKPVMKIIGDLLFKERQYHYVCLDCNNRLVQIKMEDIEG